MKVKLNAVALFLAICLCTGLVSVLGHAAIYEGREATPPVVYSGEELVSAVSGKNVATNVGLTDCGYVGEQVVSLKLYEDSRDPSVLFVPATELSADEYKYIVINVRTNVDLSVHPSGFAIYTDTEGATGFSEEHIQLVGYEPTAAWQTMVFDMTNVKGWNGKINSLRLDYLQGGAGNYAAGEFVYIYDITFLPSDEGVGDIVRSMGDKVNDCALASVGGVVVFDDFTDDELSFFGGKNINQTLVSLIEGDIVFTASNLVSPHDPYVHFDYSGIAEKRGMNNLSAEQVRHIVIRYAMDKNVTSPTVEIFYCAGDIYGARPGYSVACSGKPTGNWELADIRLADMAGWEGAVNGFRIDWCSDAPEGARMLIDSIMFFESGVASGTYIKAASMYCGTSYVHYNLTPAESEPSDDDFFEEETDTEVTTEESTTEEEMPTFPEEESTNAVETTGTGSATGDEITNAESNESESETEPREESTTNSTGAGPTLPGDGGEAKPKSKVPFYAASVSMSVMTLVAIVLIAVMKIKDLICAKHG